MDRDKFNKAKKVIKSLDDVNNIIDNRNKNKNNQAEIKVLRCFD